MTLFFSVVIPTYNRRDSLHRCLTALAEQTLSPSEFEVIVAVDGSSDGTSESLKNKTYPYVLRLLTLPNRGAASARNAGMEAATGEFMAFTEDDVVPTTQWLERAKSYLDQQKMDVVDGETVDLKTRKSLRRMNPDGIPAFLPCNLFVRKSVLRAIGGYDERFYDAARHLYFREDSDLGFRILDAGYSVAIAADVIVGHPYQFASLEDCLRHARRYVFDALLYKKSAHRYRSTIEVKNFFGFRIRRPQYLLTLGYVCLLSLAIYWAIMGPTLYLWWALAAVGTCMMIFRFKYQGRQALRLYRLRETLGFFWVPLVYLGSLIQGAVRYRSWGVLRPW